jgi:hypothetical protein
LKGGFPVLYLVAKKRQSGQFGEIAGNENIGNAISEEITAQE